MSGTARPTSFPTPRALVEAMRGRLRARHYSPSTERSYVAWVRRFIRFHHRQHPAVLGEPEVSAFLAHLARTDKVAASTQNQAMSAILFLYVEVLERPLDTLERVPRAKRPIRVPVVLTRAEVRAILANIAGPSHLVCSLLYGAGKAPAYGSWNASASE